MSERYRGLRFERKRPKWLPPVIFLAVLILALSAVLYVNHTYDEYVKLDYADKLVIDEFQALVKNQFNESFLSII